MKNILIATILLSACTLSVGCGKPGDVQIAPTVQPEIAVPKNAKEQAEADAAQEAAESN